MEIPVVILEASEVLGRGDLYSPIYFAYLQSFYLLF